MQGHGFKVANLPAQKLAYTNRVYVNKKVFDELLPYNKGVTIASDPTINLKIVVGHAEWIFQATTNRDCSSLSDNEIGFNALQRKSAQLTLDQPIEVHVYNPSVGITASVMTISVDLLKKGGNIKPFTLDSKDFTENFVVQFSGQVLCVGQQLAMDFTGLKLDLVVEAVEHVDTGDLVKQGISRFGQVQNVTSVSLQRRQGSTTPVQFSGAAMGRNDNLFRKDFDFQAMGIGGLGHEFEVIFRRAFASRIFPGLVKELGINHVRGILLYGPPGCGKTLIARKIGQVLNSRPPKIVNGPEILDKYVGGSEEKIRELFADAEKEQAEAGDQSMLHIIIFDEMDAVMKSRGSSRDSTGVGDSIVNQLLSKIDGVDSLNNILIIGMTNRKDLIDEAILRPGRLEMHIEIGLPDEAGRIQILNIHTEKMRKNNRITPACLDGLPHIAKLTKNYTGAEIEGLVRSAVSFALSRNVDVKEIKAVDESSIMVDITDFERAMTEVVPAFGQKDASEMTAIFRNGICDYGFAHQDLWNTLQRLVNQTKTSARTPLMTVLLEGPHATGKSAIAAKLCAESDFPLVRMITPDSMIGSTEWQKCQVLMKTFSDAYKSPMSVIFIDDIERIIEYTPIGQRFSNQILQTLLVLLRKIPPVENRKLMVVATTAISDMLDHLQLTQAFNVTLHVGCLQSPDEYAAVLRENAPDLTDDEIKNISHALTRPIGIKQLLMVLEMARADTDTVTADHFLSCLHTCGY